MPVDIYGMIPVAQGKNNARHKANFGTRRNNSVEPVGHVSGLTMAFHIFQQVHAEVVQAQIRNRDAGFDVFQINDFILQTAELLLAISKVAALRGQHVFIAGGHCIHNDHTVFHALFQIDIFIQGDVRPVVYQLDGLVARTNAVDTPETLNYAHRVPMDVVIDQVVAILKVLAFGNAVRADQQVQFMGVVRHGEGFFFGARREKCQQFLKTVAFAQSAFGRCAAGYQSGVNICLVA